MSSLIQLIHNDTRQELQCICLSRHKDDYWAQWELDGEPVFRVIARPMTSSRLTSLRVCQIARSQQLLTIPFAGDSSRASGMVENMSILLSCDQYPNTRGGVPACSRQLGKLSVKLMEKQYNPNSSLERQCIG